MLRAYKYRLDPTIQQTILLNKHFGACRFIYNLGLETRIYAYNTHRVTLNYYDLAKQLTDLKLECVWLNEISAQALQQSLMDLEKAYTNFFKHNTSFPKFKSKYRKQSFRIPTAIKLDFEENRLYIPKFREGIKIVIDRQLKGYLRSCTVTKTPTGKYYVSVLVETNQQIPNKKPIRDNKKTIGIDLGLSNFIITSEGIKIGNPKFLRKEILHLSYLQRQASKKVKGSKNRRKANLKIAKQYEKISNKRKDFQDKLSTELVKNHDTICLETLKVANMVKNHNLAMAISDVSWSEFVNKLKYKADWTGKNILQINTFEPSSKQCNNCGNLNHDLELSDREWTCTSCKETHDRDINAAKNIKYIALKNNKPAAGNAVTKSVELPTLVGAMKQKYNKSYRNRKVSLSI